MLKKTRIAVVFFCFLISGLLLLSCRTSPTRLSYLVNFEMEDQFKNTYTHEDFEGRVLVVIGSDKDGASLAKEWGNALTESLNPEKDSPKVNLVGLSNLRGVPFFLKGYVRGKFPKDKKDWALLDWQGLFAGTYGFAAKEANILVFDAAGDLVHKAHFSDCNPEDVRSITALVRRTIKDQ